MSAVGKTKINTHSDYAVYTFWNFLVYASETIIFFLAGLIVGINVWNEEKYINGSDYYKLLILYVILNASRVLMLLMSFPFLQRHGYGLSPEEVNLIIFLQIKIVLVKMSHDRRLERRDQHCFCDVGKPR